jgi:hypothetical protein
MKRLPGSAFISVPSILIVFNCGDSGVVQQRQPAAGKAGRHHSAMPAMVSHAVFSGAAHARPEFAV